MVFLLEGMVTDGAGGDYFLRTALVDELFQLVAHLVGLRRVALLSQRPAAAEIFLFIQKEIAVAGLAEDGLHGRNDATPEV